MAASIPLRSFVVFILTYISLASMALAGSKQLPMDQKKDTAEKYAEHNMVNTLTAHKALYDVQMVATRSGSQVINISGNMYYEWKPACDAWITDHRFNLVYEYVDSPGMRITSDFSTFETYNGESFNFSAQRKRDNNLYQELRGKALVADKGGVASFTIPQDLQFDLSQGILFPMAHTVKMIEKAKAGENFFKAIVFDGSDEEGPVEINTFIGKPVNALKLIEGNKNIDMSLVNVPAWNVRMAVFPLNDEEESDYEMSVVFHENGIISDMLVEYDNFSVTQKLVALEKVEKLDSCHNEITAKNSKN